MSHRLILACSLVFFASSLWGQELLLREVVSREYSLSIGSDSSDRHVTSREFSLAVRSGRAEGEVTSRELVLAVADDAPPPALTDFGIEVSPTGSEVSLDWSGYGAPQYRDIGQFWIYLSDDGPITSLVDLTPVLTTDGETFSATLTGLSEFRDHFLAIVPVDSAGNFDPAVNYGAAYVISPEIISRELSLFIGREPISPYREVISREYDLAISPSEPPSALTDLMVSVSSLGDIASLDWSGYNQGVEGPIERFDIYLSDDGPITDVTGLTPLRSLPGMSLRVELSGLSQNRDHFFAVVPVNAAGAFQSVVNYAAAYVLSPEIVSRELSLFVGETSDLTQDVSIVSREYDILVPDSSIPAPVTGGASEFLVTTSRTAFGAVDLDFSDYNELEQLDVVRYDVYVQDRFFDTVTGLTPFAQLPLGDQKPILAGLPGGAIRHIAVVAVDALGGFDPTVRSFSAQASISGLGEVTDLAGSATGTTLSFFWIAPEDAVEFLQGFEVQLGDADPVRLPVATTSYDVTGLTPATGYPFRVSTVDIFGNVSGGTSLNASTLLPNPTGVFLIQSGGDALLQWQPTQPEGLVAFYEVYRTPAAFTDISGLQPLGVSLGTEFNVGPIAALSDAHFAVVAVNALGAKDLTVVSISSDKQAQTITFADLSLGASPLSLNAIASSGLPVIFSVNPRVGRLTDSGNAVEILRGGLLEVTATQPGDARFWAAPPVTRILRVAPLIRSFAVNGVEITPTTEIGLRSETLSVVADDVDGIREAEFFLRPFGNGVFTSLGSDLIPGDGLSTTFLTAPFAPGRYDLQVTVTTFGDVTNSTTRSVSLVRKVPLRPVIESPASGLLTRSQMLTVTGTAEPGAQVQLFSNGTLLTTVAASEAGAFSGTISLQAGTNDLSARALNDAGDSQASDPVSVTLESALSLAVMPTSATEGTTISLIVSRNHGSGRLQVRLRDVVAGQVTLPTSVILPDGETSVSVLVPVIDDQVAEATSGLRLSATAPGYRSATATLLIEDDDQPTLTLTANREVIAEGAELGQLRFTLTRTPVTATPFVVQLSSSAPATLKIPTQIQFGPFAGSTSFLAELPNNEEQNEDTLVRIGARILDVSSGELVSEAMETAVLVTDDDGATLRLSFDQQAVPEGGVISGKVNRSGPTTASLTVQLAYTPSGRLSGPASVTIPADQREVGFSIEGLPDNILENQESIVVRAQASEFSPVERSLVVNDLPFPDLVVSQVSIDAPVLTQALTNYRYRLANRGVTRTPRAFETRVYLSRDALLDVDDVLLEAYEYPDRLAPGQEVERSDSFNTPSEVGDYFILVVVDQANGVIEVIEDNNLRASARFENQPAYTASVSTEVEVAPTNSEIPFTGMATNFDGSPAAEKLVHIAINTEDTERTLETLTDAQGRFSTIFQPLRGEGGTYGVAALHPGQQEIAVQDSFTLLGVSTEPRQLALSVTRGGSATMDSFTVSNLANIPLNEITFELLDAPAGLIFEGSLRNLTELDGDSMAEADLTVEASMIAPDLYEGQMRICSVEGAKQDVPIVITVRDPSSRLLYEGEPIDRGMLRGDSSFVNLPIRNQGGAHSGPISILIPSEFPWLTAATVMPAPSLAPGERAELTLQLTPPADLAFGEYTGSIVLETGSSRVSVPFALRPISDRLGSFTVLAEDEFTYYAEGRPPLAGCRVRLCDVFSREIVAESTTGADGLLTFDEVVEGYYVLKASAEDHANFERTIFIQPGTNNRENIFLQRQTVRYTWNVVPTRVRDRYRIVLETEFETNVPAPVVTIEPAFVDLDELTEETTQIDFTITNHGLIRADDVSLGFGSNSDWRISALTEDLGDLEAKSSRVVPVVFQRLGERARNARNCSGSISGRLQWFYECGEYSLSGSVGISLAANDRPGQNCGGGRVTPVGGGGGGGGGGNFNPVASSSGGSCDPCVARAILDCGIGFIPVVGCGYAAGTTALTCADQGASRDCLIDTAQTGFGCVCDAFDLASLGLSGGVCGALNCFVDLLQCAFPQDMRSRSYDAVLADFQRAGRRVEAMMEFELTLVGDPAWRPIFEEEGTSEFMELFRRDIAGETEAAIQITTAERAALLSTMTGQNHPQLVESLIERWHRSLDYWERGYVSIEDIPTGESRDFIEPLLLAEAGTRIVAAYDEARAMGFEDPVEAFGASLQDMFDFLSSGDGVCARVRLQIEQEAVLTRDAFAASLNLDNSGVEPLTNVQVEVRVLNDNGEDSTDLFGIAGPEISGLNSGVVAAGSAADWAWTIIPGREAAPEQVEIYFVEGVISYVLGGIPVEIPLAPQRIRVLPNPSLKIKYFHERDVFSDDPFTDVIEPSIPFTLGVMVENTGGGIARDLSITSGQPEIIENEKGLLIDFEIIGSEVDGRSFTPSLEADFGQLVPGEIKIGRWLMTSSLHGHFRSFSAQFEHLDGLGNESLSLIESVEIHEMVRQVEVTGAKADGKPDFLTNDVADILKLPDTIHLSDGSTATVAVSTEATVGTPTETNLTIQIQNTGLGSGFGYLRIDDPADGRFRLLSCRRSDGQEIPLSSNVWVTDRTFIGFGLRPVRENKLHLFDCDSSGTYTLTYGVGPAVDTEAPTSRVTALPSSSSPLVTVRWTGTDTGDGIASYDVFVSENGGAFSPWLTGVTQTEALYRGTSGASYQFYSQAIDRQGNQEPAKNTAEAMTLIDQENQVPVLNLPAVVRVAEGSTLIYQIQANDLDGPTSDLRFEVTSANPGIIIDRTTGRLRFRPGEADGGTTIPVNVIVSDGSAIPATAQGTFSIQVEEINAAPVLANPGSYQLDIGQPLALTLAAEDGDLPAQQLSYSIISGAPTGMNLQPTSGLLTWTPTAVDEKKSYQITVEVSDNQSPPAVARRTLFLEVLEDPGTPPEFDAFPVLSWMSGSAQSATLSASDPEGQPVTLSADLSALPGGWKIFDGPLDSGRGTLEWSLLGVPPGTYELPVTASTSRQSVSRNLTIEVLVRPAFDSFESWLAAYSVPASQNGGNDSLNSPGLPNLLAYATGVDPRRIQIADQPASPPQASLSASRNSLLFTAPTVGRADLIYEVVASNDLFRTESVIARRTGRGSWTGSASIEILETRGGLDVLRVAGEALNSDSPSFIRLRIQRQ